MYGRNLEGGTLWQLLIKWIIEGSAGVPFVASKIIFAHWRKLERVSNEHETIKRRPLDIHKDFRLWFLTDVSRLDS